ncbi:glycosyltransferase family 4 protein [Carboxylicivirga mesophila]|uniref:Glycosyltransferase family 4 protein n=1 Tax=Carboxylicivirga mesophila TaxID=1166478 RepID=A0ABS5KAR7_9BACT|nr:glycosyltransferase family 4 protein [Carboxylicivirga mesophila]MBS2212120.1 glycosyltransferase family 4 protein [Carboxylicivirga mesophila]
MKKNILFLYTELAGYFVACINELATQKNISVHVVRWPVNKEAPFQFDIDERISIYERDAYNDISLMELVDVVEPDIIICSGWVDKGYVNVCKRYRGKIPTVMSMDNQWHGSLKQRLACLAAPFKLHSAFSQAWVPGEPQKAYAQRLGFKKVETGFYSADTKVFEPLGLEKIKVGHAIPKRLLYVGRYIPQKGIDKLFESFLELIEEGFTGWELHCLGTGELFDQRPIHDNIHHHGFVQPTDMHRYLKSTGVFVLPSDFEPWGVVTHEMAVAGFPMVISSAVGSVTMFLNDGENGYIFKQGSKEALKKALKKMMQAKDSELRDMATASFEKGMSWTPERWVETIIRMI